jgi:hypothetical protein
MNSHDRIARGLLLLAAAGLALPAHAGWSSDPAQNFCLADRPQQQTQPLMVPTADGGCYVSWFDDAGGGYDVYLQRLDAQGNELWPHNGILVADRTYNDTHSYGLDVDAQGCALLTFREERDGGDQIIAQRISAEGDLMWGAEGVQLTTGSAYVASPKIAATTDDHVVVGWGHDESVRLQRLDADGVPLWDPPVTMSDTAGGAFWMGDLHASLDGSVIVALRRDGPNYWDPKHIWAQRVSADGKPVWDQSPLIVFDGGSIQFGNFPSFDPDGAGGAIFCWYSDAPCQCYVQHVSAAGEELFGHNGSVAATNAMHTRTGPAACYHAANDEMVLFWIEHWVDEHFIDYWGVYGQRYDGAGTRLWGNSGLVLLPLETVERLFTRTILCDDGAMVFWAQNTDPLEYSLEGARVDQAGEFLWDPMPLIISSRPSDKAKISAIGNTEGVAFLAWSDDLLDLGDICAQNVNINGTLGVRLGDIDGDGDVDTADLLALLAAWGPCENCPEDLDGNGVVDTADLLTLLANWG